LIDLKKEGLLIMSSNINLEDTGSVAKCDIFDFFANHLGLTVIHPGGLKATRKLEDSLEIDSNTKVLDIACGKGSTAFYLAEKYGCSVVGIDISEELIQEANDACEKKGLNNKVKFQVGNAMDLPFDDSQFDIAISQGILVFVDDKTKTINEASRVLKDGGKAGWVELSWKKEPDEDFLDKVYNVLRAYCLTNARTYEGWEQVFERANIHNLDIIKGKTITSNFFETLKEEGIVNTIKITFNSMKNSEIRSRLKIMGNFVENNSDYFGYGVYVIEKT
jgi:ubiquinone/menaquinone biosynthesis C-methylase UbiE